MKRTTIFPSRLAQFSLAAGLALGALAAASRGLAAQQPPAARPATAAAQPPASLPATHVVQQGETLWGLAQQLLGDPLLWPEIYRLNTAVIEDPHWIFPGEELRLSGAAEATAAAPPAGAEAAAPAEVAVTPAQAANPTPAPQGDITVAPAAADTEPARAQQGPVVNPASGTTIFAQQGKARISAGSLQLREQRAYRAVREGEYYSAGFVLEPGEELTSGRLLGNTATSSISRLATTTSTMLYGTVAVVPPPGDALKPGDFLLSYDTPRVIPDHGSQIRPTGLLKVTAVGAPGDNVMAQVMAVYQTIDGGQGVLKAESYRSPRGVRPVAVPGDSGVEGLVIDLSTPHEVANEQDRVFIDKGSEDGVHLGDVFQVSKMSSPQAEVGAIVQKQAQLLIVYVRPHMATGVIIQVDRPDIRAGSTVRQILRLPS